VPTLCPYTMSSSLGATPSATRWSYTARMSAYVSSSLGTPVLAPYLREQNAFRRGGMSAKEDEETAKRYALSGPRCVSARDRG
jgi:hypothetical protein